jgi:hypothetical protein
MADLDETGAIDWLLIEAPDKTINGELVPESQARVSIFDRGFVYGDAAYDALLTTADLDEAQVGELGDLAGASSGLLSHDDAKTAVSTMQPDNLGMLIVYENLWSLPFAVAVRRAGGQLVAQGHIPIPAVVAALDALEA